MSSRTFRRSFQSLSKAVGILGFALLPAFFSNSQAQEVPGGCGFLSAQGRFGPYDYRADRYVQESTYRSHRALLGIVENAHFTPEVEGLFRGKTGAAPIGDMAYTLHAFPNHHRALIAMVRLGEKEQTDKPAGSPYSLDCWFQRAITWRQDDLIVRMIYANHLSRKQKNEEAERQLVFVASQAADNAFTYHNIGLIYFDMKNYDKALSFAHKAYDLGLGAPTLRDLLKSAGKWTEPSTAVQGEAVKKAP